MANSKCCWQCPEDWEQWSQWLAAGLHARNRWRLPVLLTGILFAHERRSSRRITIRRPSHADRRKALRRQITEHELSTLAAAGRLPQKILQLTDRLMTLAM
jgi:hypothetical protein